MKNKKYVIGLALAVAFFASRAHAEGLPGFSNGSGSDQMNKPRPGMMVPKGGEVREIRKENRDEITSMMKDRREAIDENKSEIEAKRADIETEIADLKVKMESAKTQEERAQLVSDFQSKHKELKYSMQKTREDNRSEIKEKTADIHAARAEAFTKVFNAMVDRIEKLSVRISSRIDKLALAGADMTKAKASLAIAQTDLANTKDLFSKLPVVTDSTYKASTMAVKKSLMDTQKALTDTLGVIKGNSETKTSSTVPQTETVAQ